MREAARLGLPVAVHAESEELTRALSAQATGRTARGVPRVAAGRRRGRGDRARARCSPGRPARALHIVHVSSGRGVALAAEARARGVDVSIETCPHYLFFTDEDVERLGVVAKCAPPLRTRGRAARRSGHALDGRRVDIVGLRPLARRPGA